jgi:hypothetical protein
MRLQLTLACRLLLARSGGNTDDVADDGTSDEGPVVPWAHLLDDKGNGEFYPITDLMKQFWTELYEEFPDE